MQGYIQNEGNQAYFIVQRQIPPSGKVSIEDIYKSVGKKSGLDEDLEFVEWLKANIFTRGTWGYYDDLDEPLFVEKKPVKKPAKKASPKKKITSTKTSSKKAKDARGAGRALRRDVEESTGIDVTAGTIIEAPYEQARSLIERTRDRSVLKKALTLTQHFGGKEQHQRHIMKRLEQV